MFVSYNTLSCFSLVLLASEDFHSLIVSVLMNLTFFSTAGSLSRWLRPPLKGYLKLGFTTSSHAEEPPQSEPVRSSQTNGSSSMPLVGSPQPEESLLSELFLHCCLRDLHSLRDHCSLEFLKNFSGILWTHSLLGSFSVQEASLPERPALYTPP